MFLTIQFPIVDYRDLEDFSSKALKPRWPNPDVANGKMRYFGKINARTHPIFGPWDGEQRYCNAKSVFNFCGLDDHHYFNSLKEKWNSGILFRRFQSDGKFLAKFEVGFKDGYERNQTKGVKAANYSIYEHIGQYLNCPVKVKVGKKLFDFIPLIHSGIYLREAYFWSSSLAKRNFNQLASDDRVETDEPLLIVQLDKKAFETDGFRAVKITNEVLAKEGIDLFYDYAPYRINGSQGLIKIWFILVEETVFTLPLSPTNFNLYNPILRDLRINLLRIHSEKVVLKRILDRITDKREGYKLKNPDVRTRVLYQLHKILFNLSKPNRNAQPQDQIVNTAFHLEEMAETRERLEDRLESLKMVIDWLKQEAPNNAQVVNITTQIYKTMGDQITIGSIQGNFINKSSLVNSLNSTTDLTPEMKSALMNIAKKIEDSKDAAAAVMFNSLNDELVKPKAQQDKGKMKQFWDGLAKIIPDVLTIGKALIPFIL